MVKSGVTWILAACFLLPACGDDGDAEPGGDEHEHIELVGDWEGNFYGTHAITEESWTSTYDPYVTVAEIVEFSNDDNDAILLGEDGTYGRNVWTEIEDDSFYYCSVSFGKASVEEAIDESQPFDDGDPDNVGCGDTDSPWSLLTKQ